MVDTRHKLAFNTKTNILKNLISALESHEGIKSQLLKSTYYFLIQLSSNPQYRIAKGADLNEFCIKTNEGEIITSLKDIHTISIILFKDLEKLMKQLHSSKHDISANRSLKLEELNLLIRCCMVSLTFHVPQLHLLESVRVLLLIFKKLSLLQVAEGHDENVDLKRSNSCQCMFSGESQNSYESFANFASLSSLEIFDHCIPSITAILEVLIDELLVHGQLRKYFQIIDSFSFAKERLFKQNTNYGDFGVIMDLICSHFSLSIADEVALQEFLSKITHIPSDNSKNLLELSIISSRTLLHNPAIISSPELIQAHIVSLISNVISTTDFKLIDYYLSAFESSVILYNQHMSILKTDNQSTDSRGILVNAHSKIPHPSFESCIDSAKKEKIDQKITMLNDSWNSNLRKKFFKNKYDLIASSVEYIHESVCIVDITCRDEIVDFLEHMLVRAANDVNDIELPLNGDTSLQDICYLASLLMLMSNSLIKTVSCLRNQYPDYLIHKEYGFIMGIVNRFKDFSIRLQIQKYSCNMMETNSTSHKESRLMLFHFLGLLSLCFDSGIDFLVKSCISVIMGLTNLFVLEEGNIDALRSLVDPKLSSSDRSVTVYKEDLLCQYATQRVAAKFLKIQKLYLSNASATNDSTLTENLETENLSTELVPYINGCVSNTLETCNGETYLKTRLKGSGKVTDFDDLADFVECKKGKDYYDWLKSRDRFRERKLEKRAKRMWEKKKQAWRSSMRGTI